nr:hypothetical protein [Tanacetum cinerariifolium]
MTNLHFIHCVCHSILTVVRSVEAYIVVMIANQETYPSMIRFLVTIKILGMTSLHSILWISNNSLIIVRSVEVPIIALIVKPGTSLSMSLLWDTNRIVEELLRTLKINPPIREPEGVTIRRRDKVIITIPARENNKFIKSSVDDFVPIPRESEVTSVSIDFECEDSEINFNPSWNIEELEHLLANDLVHVPRVFDEPLDNSDLMSRSIETIGLILEELTTEIGLEDSILIEINDGYYDSEGDIVYFKQLLNEDTYSNLYPALLPTESSLLVLPLPIFKQTCLREVEKFDPFFSLT